MSRREGLTSGALVLAAFLLYGIGSALADQPAGLALVMLNSVAVTIVVLIGFRLLRQRHRRIGISYLVARTPEAILLAGGIGLVAFNDSDKGRCPCLNNAMPLSPGPAAQALNTGHSTSTSR